MTITSFRRRVQIQPLGFGMPAMRAAILARTLREQLVELLHRDAGCLAEHSDRRPRALLEILLAHEFDDLPVLVGQGVDAVGLGHLDGHVLGPLLRLLEEAFVVDGDVDAGEGGGAHGFCLLDAEDR
ncbi:MAG: hypothetical protein R2715_04925 [Ilumatobacteraceae bacterium]